MRMVEALPARALDEMAGPVPLGFAAFAADPALAAAALGAALDDGDGAGFLEAMALVATIGHALAPAVQDALSSTIVARLLDDDTGVDQKLPLAELLATLGVDDDARGSISAHASSSCPRTRAAAVCALAIDALPEELPRFGALLADDDPRVVEQVGLAIARCGGDEAVTVLRDALLRHADEAHRRALVRALARVVAPSAADALRALSRDVDPEVRLLAVAALVERRACLDGIEDGLLDDEDGRVRLLGWRAVEKGLADPARARAHVEREPDPRIRRAATDALWARGLAPAA